IKKKEILAGLPYFLHSASKIAPMKINGLKNILGNDSLERLHKTCGIEFLTMRVEIADSSVSELLNNKTFQECTEKALQNIYKELKIITALLNHLASSLLVSDFKLYKACQDFAYRINSSRLQGLKFEEVSQNINSFSLYGIIYGCFIDILAQKLYNHPGQVSTISNF
ncbi:MAG: hypothetical protein MHPSP_000669, partial [Paramarteilia canceri]